VHHAETNGGIRAIGLATLALSVGLLTVSAGTAFAYIDPGTTAPIITNLAPLLVVLGSALVIALWPLRLLCRWLHKRQGLAKVSSWLYGAAFAGVVAYTLSTPLRQNRVLTASLLLPGLVTLACGVAYAYWLHKVRQYLGSPAKPRGALVQLVAFLLLAVGLMGWLAWRA